MAGRGWIGWGPVKGDVGLPGSSKTFLSNTLLPAHSHEMHPRGVDRIGHGMNERSESGYPGTF